jgi:hypothetical protein
MHANEQSLTFIGNEDKITIPFFQRGYVWDENNWEDLITDLVNFKRNHFLGSLILKHQLPVSGQPREVLVIDGQQRLTTLSVMIKALYDLFPPELQENAGDAIRTYLHFKKNKTDKHHQIKINHSHADRHSYKQVIDGKDLHLPEKLNLITKDSNRILQCYKYFVNYLKTKTQETRTTLFNALLDDNNKILVVIDLEHNDNEQAIFDTINSAGVRLSAADIIKNALLQRVIAILKAVSPISDQENQEQAISLYQSSWQKTFMLDEMEIKFWDTDRPTGRLMRDNIEILLHCYATIKGFYDPDKHTLDELADLYKSAIDTKSTLNEITSMINEICEYADIYRKYIISFDSSSSHTYEGSLARLLHILEAQQITTFHPFILSIVKSDKSECEKNDIFKKLEIFVIHRMITSDTTKNYNKICKEFLADISRLNAYSAEKTIQQVRSGLCKIANAPAKLLLFWIELFRRHNDNKVPLKKLNYIFSLEHLMPQKWEEHWNDLPLKKNPDNSDMTPEQSIRDRYSKVYFFGNMTLLTSSLNTSLRNYKFVQKMEGQGRNKGIKNYDDLFITKNDIVDPYDAGDKIWDEIKIENRTNALADEILSIWPASTDKVGTAAPNQNDQELGSTSELVEFLKSIETEINAKTDCGFNARGTAKTFRHIVPNIWLDRHPLACHYEIFDAGKGNIGIEFHIEGKGVPGLTDVISKFAGDGSICGIPIEFLSGWCKHGRIRLSIPIASGNETIISYIGKFIELTMPAIANHLNSL